MRKQLFFSLFALCAASLVHAAVDSGDATGQTFFSVRPQYQSVMPEHVSLNRDRGLAKDNGWGGYLGLTPYGGQSGNKKGMAEFFMFSNKNELTVDGAFANFATRHVNPTHFNVIATIGGGSFSSKIKFRPEQTSYGLGLTWRQYLHGRDAVDKHWWFEASGPVQHVKNNMKLTESSIVSSSPGGTHANMVAAFKGVAATTVGGSSIKYGKINGARKKTGFADLELKIGYDWLCEDACHAEGWVGVLVPTGNKPKAEYMFEPIVGHNQHFGVMWGGSYGFEVWSECDKYLHLELATVSKYLFKNDEYRMLSVKGKPWSQYMLVYKDSATSTSETVSNASEYFRRKMDVTPGYMFNMNTGLVYTHCGLQAEIGYNFYAKQTEKVSFKTAWSAGPAFALLDSVNQTVAPSPTTAVGRIDRFADIANGSYPNDSITASNAVTTGGTAAATAASGHPYSTANAIQQGDFDLAATAHPATLSHTIYGSIGYRWDDMCYPLFVGAGGSYEFSRVNTAMHRWTAWGKFGISY